MSAAWAAVIVASATTAAASLAAMARVLFRWARLEDRVAANIEKLTELTTQIREDRKASNDRLTWLERQLVWLTATRGGRPRAPRDSG